MEAPEKIYLVKDYNTDNHMDYWYSATTDDTKVEYVRKDAFIEKAANYLNYMLYDRVEIKKTGTIIPSLCTKGEFIEDFKKYMEL